MSNRSRAQPWFDGFMPAQFGMWVAPRFAWEDYDAPRPWAPKFRIGMKAPRKLKKRLARYGLSVAYGGNLTCHAPSWSGTAVFT